MRISSAFPSKYLKATDLNGREAHVKIDTVKVESMETSGDEKPVLYFIGKDRGLVLNKTNAEALSTALGDETEAWHGKSVVLFESTTSYGGRTVPCLRVRVPRQQPPQPAAVPQPVAPVDDLPPANAAFNAEGDAAQDDIPF
jgi:hypothetical protein